jgi:hypothetical protein
VSADAWDSVCDIEEDIELFEPVLLLESVVGRLFEAPYIVVLMSYISCGLHLKFSAAGSCGCQTDVVHLSVPLHQNLAVLNARQASAARQGGADVIARAIAGDDIRILTRNGR